MARRKTRAAGLGTATPAKRILVLGAYGFIGSGIVEYLQSRGLEVTGLGRDQDTALRTFPALNWHICDLARLQSADAWRGILDGIDVVVNCAGALQDGGADRLDVVHYKAISALSEACAANGAAIVQISAVGATQSANSAFFRTKASGDEAVQRSGARHWIIRPGLVIGRSAYGSTALMRMLAAVPLLQPIAFGDALVQTVGLPDLARSVEMAIESKLPDGAAFDLVEERPHRLIDIVEALRVWLGFGAARMTVTVPAALVRPVSIIADLLGHLGWRSPLRTTAIAAVRRNVTGDSAAWNEIAGAPVSDLQATLAGMTALPADRLSARIALIMPVTVAVLFVFWLVSGLTGLLRLDAAAQILVNAGWSGGLAKASVAGWSLVDIALAGLILVRAYARRACMAMAMVSAIYLVAATIEVPVLWVDPLGPLVKILPAMVLAIAGAAMLEPR